MCSEYRTVRRISYLTWKKELWRGEVIGGMHLLQDTCHTLLGLLFFTHFKKLASGNSCLFEPLLKFLV